MFYISKRFNVENVGILTTILYISNIWNVFDIWNILNLRKPLVLDVLEKFEILSLDFVLQILQEWFWSYVGFLKENQDFKIFENFFVELNF